MPLANHRILIVDDDLSYLDTLESMIAAMNASQILRADCGENAVGTLTSMDRPVDCVVTNYGMPRGNGLQLLQYVRMGRVKTLRPDACVVVFSGERSAQVIKTAKDLDVSGYLASPFTPEQLHTAIRRGRSRYFKADFARYAAVQVPEYVVGGSAPEPAPPPPVVASPVAAAPRPAADGGDSARRDMASLIMRELHAGKSGRTTTGKATGTTKDKAR